MGVAKMGRRGGPLSQHGELAGATLVRSLNAAHSSNAVSKLKQLQDALSHETTSRTHEAGIHALAEEYATLQARNAIVNADAGIESKLLATEYSGHLERRLRAAAYD